jgi:hypothetical protein
VVAEFWGRRDLGLRYTLRRVLYEHAVGGTSDKLLAFDRPASSGEGAGERSRWTTFLDVDDDEAFASKKDDIAPELVSGGRRGRVGEYVEKGVWDASGDGGVRRGLFVSGARMRGCTQMGALTLPARTSAILKRSTPAPAVATTSRSSPAASLMSANGPCVFLTEPRQVAQAD